MNTLIGIGMVLVILLVGLLADILFTRIKK